MCSTPPNGLTAQCESGPHNGTTSSPFQGLHLCHFFPVLPVASLHLDHLLDVCLSQSFRALMQMRRGFAELGWVFHPSIEFLSPQLQHPQSVRLCEEQAGGDRDLTRGGQMDEAVLCVQSCRGKSLGQGVWRRSVEDLVPERRLCGGRHSRGHSVRHRFVWVLRKTWCLEMDRAVEAWCFLGLEICGTCGHSQGVHSGFFKTSALPLCLRTIYPRLTRNPATTCLRDTVRLVGCVSVGNGSGV